MDNGNKRKHALLGMPFGTANGKLRKMILFDFAQQLDKDLCYRCKLFIQQIDDFTIEHKDAWMGASNPKEAFFDLGNIAFSHTKCNIGAGVRSPLRKYTSTKKRKQVEWTKYYARHKDEINAKKRLRDRRDPTKHGPDKCSCEPGKSCGGRPRL